MLVDVAISPAGDVWVTNNWQNRESCFGDPDEALSTRCSGQGVVIFFGMAKPVRMPQIGTEPSTGAGLWAGAHSRGSEYPRVS
jgi:hypothetical protein